jgi:hypothetical protein
MPPAPGIPTVTPKLSTPCGPAYVTFPTGPGAWFKVELAQEKTCPRVLLSVAAGLARLALGNGATLEEVAKEFAGHVCQCSSPSVPSCSSAIAAVLREHAAQPKEAQGGK